MMTKGAGGVVKLGVIGCGDVAFRGYLPTLQALGEKAEVAACFDPAAERADKFARSFRDARVRST